MLCIRGRYYVGDLERDPDLENHPYEGSVGIASTLLVGLATIKIRAPVHSLLARPPDPGCAEGPAHVCVEFSYGI